MTGLSPAVAFAVLAVLQAFSLAWLLDLRSNVESLSWNERAYALFCSRLQIGHLVGSILGIAAAALLARSRSRYERNTVLVLGVPVLLSSATWCAWAISQLRVEYEVAPLGGAGILGIVGILTGLGCPVMGFARIKRSAEERGEGRSAVLTLFSIATLAWTLAALVLAIPTIRD